MSYIGDQMWTCLECDTERKWGEGKPEGNGEHRPLLNCAGCKRVTRHRFSRVDYDFQASLKRELESPLAHRKEQL